MEYRPLKITLISAEGIKDVNLFSKMDVYAVVSLAGYPKSKNKTPVDKDCGTNPKWNHRMEFIVDEPYLTKPGLSLVVQLIAEKTLRTDKEIGSVTIPIHDLFHDNTNDERVVEYQVRMESGKTKGSVKLSYSFGDKFSHQAETKAHTSEPVTAYPNKPLDEPVTAYPAGAAPAYPGMAYPPQQYPPQNAYGGYPPQASGYGYQAPPPAGYGYPQPPPHGYAAYQQPQKPKKNKMGMGGLGMGLGAGLLGGLLVGDMVGDIGESAAYADGYGDGMGDMDMGGGFDF